MEAAGRKLVVPVKLFLPSAFASAAAFVALKLASTAAYAAPTPPPPPATRPSVDEQAIWNLERTWIGAYPKNDAAALERILTANFSALGPDGHNATRAEYLAGMTGGSLHLRSVSAREDSLRIYGESAVVTGRAILEGSDGGTDLTGIYAFTDFWVKQHGEWRAAAEDSAKLVSDTNYATAPLWRDGGSWMKRHQGFVAAAKRGGVDLLFVGDSITDFWQSRGAAQWRKFYGQYHAANIGISGDRTGHVLWRVRNGEVDGLRPKAIVLMIGTNDIGMERDGFSLRGTPEEAAEGVKAIVAELRSKCPDAKILLLGVFPRAHLAGDTMRKEVAAINQHLAGWADGEHVSYLDIGARFLQADGTLSPDIMPDYLHPSPQGYEIWGNAIQTAVSGMMR